MYVRMRSLWFRKEYARACEIICTMYGLKEASMQFYKLISCWLTKKQVFVHRRVLFLNLSTNDELIVNKQKGSEELGGFVMEFKGRFECAAATPCKKYLGVEITIHVNGAISLSMKIKIEKLKELIYPALDLHIFPTQPTYDPILKWDDLKIYQI